MTTVSPVPVGSATPILLEFCVVLDHSAQSGHHPLSERGDDFYETPPYATSALCGAEELPHWNWEPCAGNGAIVRVLRDRGHAVVASDIVSREFDLHFVADFFTLKKAPVNCTAIVSNPPYKDADRFVRHALNLVPHVHLLLRLAFLESVRRTDILEHSGLRAVHVFRNRIPFMHRVSWTGARASSAIPFAWYSWDRDYRGPTTVDRISWRQP